MKSTNKFNFTINLIDKSYIQRLIFIRNILRLSNIIIRIIFLLNSWIININHDIIKLFFFVKIFYSFFFLIQV